METLPGPLKGIFLVVEIHKIVFTAATLPRGAVLSYFLPIFLYRYFFGVPLFLENHSIASHHFFTDVLGITQMVTSLKKPFHSTSPSAGSHFEVL